MLGEQEGGKEEREVFKSRYLWFPAPCLSATRRRDACHACLCGRRYIRRHPTMHTATENKALNFLTRATRPVLRTKFITPETCI